MRSITTAMRPWKLSQMLGQSASIAMIRNEKKNVQAWLFIGETGTGKTTMARILALSLNCPHSEQIGEPCVECYKRRRDFAIHEINASETSGVDDISGLIEGSNYLPPAPSLKRVYILDEAQRLSSAAQNRLLKPFEDPPESTVWMIATTEPSKILDTLKGRCKPIELRPLSMKDVQVLVDRALKFLKSSKPLKPIYEALYEEEVRWPRAILSVVERYVAGIEPRAAVQIFGDGVQSMSLCRSLLKGDWDTVKKALDVATPEEYKVIRAKVAGYLRRSLLNQIPGPPANSMATAIDRLSQVDSFSDVTQGPATVSVLYQLCWKFSGHERSIEDEI